jgi:putative ABC transport system permease protein
VRFSQIAVWSAQQFNLATGGEIRYAKTLRVSGEFFQVLGVMPLLGRLLVPDDDQPGCAIGGADISYAFWQHNFGGDPSIVGKRVSLDGNSFEIVGVTPPGFNGISVGDTFDVAVPVCIEPIVSPRDNRLTIRHAWWLASIGRLKPGWSVARANAQMNALTPAILQETIPPFYDSETVKNILNTNWECSPRAQDSRNCGEIRKRHSGCCWEFLG